MNIDDQINIIKSNAEEIIDLENLKKKIINNKKLTIKVGFDPSAPDIHMGHTLLLRKMKQFQDLGHHIILIIGDFTATIGDPTGKNKTRKMISKKEVIENSKTYQEQAFKILNKDKTKIVSNSSWHEKLNFYDILNLCSKITVSQILERDDFNKRYNNKIPISLMEFLYPIIQGYDSIAIKSDIELGGTDQKFNLLTGRHLMKSHGLDPQSILTMPLIEGLDGTQKMSKSLNNYIALNDSPKDMFGKTMSIPDNLIIKYFKYLTDVPIDTIETYKQSMVGGENPKNIKILLAKELVSMYYNKETSEKTHEEFLKIFSQKKLPNDIPIKKIEDKISNIIELLFNLNEKKSKSEYRRLIKQGAIKINEQKIVDDKQNIDLKNEDIIKIGKREFYKIEIS